LSTTPPQRPRPVPTSRVSRLFTFGSMVSGVAGRMAVDGLRQLGQGTRPDLASVLLTPVNALRFTESLSHMRGAALKLGQMLSMDVGLVLPPHLTEILAKLRDDVKPMPVSQLASVLNAAWGPQWRSRFTHFDMQPFASASIGQVHRATTTDGRALAIKVQYPGVRASIDSDLNNAATLMRLPGLLPRGMDIAPLLSEAKRQLLEETDYVAEARHLTRFGALLAGSDTFVLPELHADFSNSTVLAMTYIESQPLESLTTAPQEVRDRVTKQLIELVLRELFDFGSMQTDPNFANYRYDPKSERVVLLDFGAVRNIAPELTADFRSLLNAALDRDTTTTRSAMQKIGYFDGKVAARHQALIMHMFETAMTPFRQDTAFDFGRTDLIERLRDMGLAMGNEQDLTHVPPAATLFLHRKIGGMYLLATKLKARVALRPMVEAYRGAKIVEP
jgi:predicted unusual protein kinase regulating ubiquinone biosynthesis (AarF/ABC1/UbiB family)